MANALRALAMDAVQAANSGHPGMPMGMAEIALALWSRHLRHNPSRSALGQPRPLHALERARLDAAVRPAAPDRLRPADRRAQALPPARLQDAGASGIPLHAGGGNHDRAARPGRRQRRRDGDRGKSARRALQPAGFRRRRPPHLRVHGRRLHDGRRLARGLRARRHPRAGQTDRLLRRQRHLDRLGKGPHRPVVHRQRARALQGLRLAGDPPRRRARRGRGRQGDPQGEARKIAPDADLLQDHDRQGRAAQAEHRRRARLAARRGRGRGDARRDRLALSAVRNSAARLRRLGRARGRQARRAALDEDVCGLRGRARRAGGRIPAPHGGRAAAGFRRAGDQAGARVRREGRNNRHAQSLAKPARSAAARVAGIGGRIGGPRPFQPHASSRARGRSGIPAAAITCSTACASSACAPS